MSQITAFTTGGGGGGGTVTSISSGTGIALSPSTITTTGSVNVTPTVALSYLTDDTNSAAPATNVLTIAGAGGITTSSSGSTVTITGSGGGAGVTVNVDQSGSVTGSTIDLFANSGSANAGGTVNFIAASGTEIDLQVSDANDNTIIGLASGNGSITGSHNTSVGALNYTALTSGAENTAFGIAALRFLVDGNNNTAVGVSALYSITSGVGNTALGLGTGPVSGDVSQNIFIGQQAGLNYTGGEANNILIGTYQLGGTVGEANTLRIGNGTGSSIGQLSQAYVAGINGVTLGGTPLFVTIDPSTDQLGVAAIPSGTVTTLHTQDGNNVTQTAGVINISGGNSLTTTGTAGPNTLTVSLTGITQYDVQTGGASNALNNVAPSATAGVPLISQGAAAQPIFGTVAIAGGGTNATSMANTDGVVYYDGTRLVTTTVGTAGQVLTSNGAVAPTFQAAPGVGTKVFAAYLNTSVSNVTGDGTQYLVILDSVFSNPGSYYSTSTGLFTAPVTGNYQFNMIVSVGNLPVGLNRMIMYAETTSAEYKPYDFTPVTSAAAEEIMFFSFLTRMSANDTCSMQVRGFGGTKTADVGGSGGGASYPTTFSGYYVSA